tara:strand:+ start:259 stop:423 length:165 start_codon:yes stop_codon:yes gene_type:complete
MGEHFGIYLINLEKFMETLDVAEIEILRSGQKETDVFAENLRLKEENKEILIWC